MKGFPDLPPIWLAAFMALAWLLAQVLPVVSVSNPVLTTVGGITVLAGLGAIAWSAVEFARHHTTIEPHETPDVLIRTGPYRLSRNPIYLGMVAILTGTVLWFGALSAVPLPGLFAGVLAVRFITPEEEVLIDVFGAEARSYMARVRRWI